MKRLFGLIIVSAILSIILSACEKNTSTQAVEDDESVVTQMAQNDEEDYLLDEGIDDVSEDNMFDGYRSFGKVSSPIDTVFRFGRIVHQRPRRIVSDIRRISPDSIVVFVAREFDGRFIVIEKADDSTFVRHQKPLRHVVRRKAVYVKRNSDTGGRPWKLASVSLGQGNSVPNATIQINEISINSSGGASVIFTDPLQTLLEISEDILTFVPGEEVTVQVKLSNSTVNPVDPFGNGSTETVLLHYGVNRRHHARKRFEYAGSDPLTGDQVYQGTWTIGQEPLRVYHAVVDAIDNGTIYDDDGTTYPYNSVTWSAPYRVVETD